MSNSQPNTYRFQALALLLLAAICNPWLASLYLPVAAAEKLFGLMMCLSATSAMIGAFQLYSRRSWSAAWSSSSGFNLLLFVGIMSVLLCSNRIYAAQFKWLRILLPGGTDSADEELLPGRGRSRNGGWKARLLTVGLSFLALFVLLEIIFMFPAQSHSTYQGSFGHINWMHRYWGEANAGGFRENEILRVKGKRNLMFLGIASPLAPDWWTVTSG